MQEFKVFKYSFISVLDLLFSKFSWKEKGDSSPVHVAGWGAAEERQ